MKHIEWTDELSVGVTKLDMQHKGVIRIANEVIRDIYSDQDGEQLHEKIKQFAGEIRLHFSSEQLIMRVNNYPAYDEHCTAHQEILEKVMDIEMFFSKDKPHAMKILETWLRDDLDPHDKQLGRYLNDLHSAGQQEEYATVGQSSSNVS